MRILVAEGETRLRETLVSFFENEGYCCEHAENIRIASQKLDLYNYDCLLVDPRLSDGNGLTLIQEVRKLHPETGIIIISGQKSLDNIIAGLDLGADDYIIKPFHLTELNSRVKSLLRRRKFNGKKELTLDNIQIIPDYRLVKIDGEPLPLTKKEFDLFLYFFINPHCVLTKEAIAEHLLGDIADSVDSLDFIYSHIKNLRQKLIKKTGKDYFQNVYGTGYKFSVEAVYN